MLFFNLPFQAPGHVLSQPVPSLSFFRHGMQDESEGGRGEEEGGEVDRIYGFALPLQLVAFPMRACMMNDEGCA